MLLVAKVRSNFLKFFSVTYGATVNIDARNDNISLVYARARQERKREDVTKVYARVRVSAFIIFI